MRSLRPAWILSVLLALPACKYEPDDKPAADPLEDPWVAGFGSEGDEPIAVAEPSSEAIAAVVEPSADAPALGEAEAAPSEAEAPAPATGVLAAPTGSNSPTAKDKDKPSSASSEPAKTEPAAAPVEPEAPAAVEPTPKAEPAKTEPAKTEPAKPTITIADFHGNYKFVGGSTQRAELEAAIDAAANQLSAAIRGIGRKRLTKTNPIDNTLEIVIAGNKVTTIFETGFDASCVIDGPTVHWSNNKGDAYKVRVRSQGSKLIQVIEGEDGVKTTVFVLSSDKQKLTVHHKITADRLKEPMTYRLSYSRK